MGLSITTAAGVVQTGNFQLSDTTRLFDEQLQLLDAAPGTKGLVGVGGPQPVGYYKDPDKSARTFVETPHGRFSVPGDWAVVNDDGRTLTLLGRGSVCINTGGEKVFPEEVEEALKLHPAVEDCTVVGIPDEKWGERIVAVVAFSVGRSASESELIASTRERLAAYKSPKQVVVVERIVRSPAGKADYRWAKETVIAVSS